MFHYQIRFRVCQALCLIEWLPDSEAPYPLATLRPTISLPTGRILLVLRSSSGDHALRSWHCWMCRTYAGFWISARSTWTRLNQTSHHRCPYANPNLYKLGFQFYLRVFLAPSSGTDSLEVLSRFIPSSLGRPPLASHQQDMNCRTQCDNQSL